MKTSIICIIVLLLELSHMEVFAKANCPRISGVPGLRVRYRGRGRVAKFRCRRKFKVIGSKMSVCINNKWTHSTPFCASTKCPKLVVSNTVDTTITLGGAMVRFHCSPGRVLRGNDTMYCAIDNTWVGTVPTCIRQAVETECDFELPNLCGWSQDKTDDFDWVMGTRRTPTASTGPDRDHTFGHGDYGHYMYVESSSPRTYGDVARFLSPIYDKTDESLCFEFWYHLKGPTGTNLTGDLKVYILQEGGTLPDPTNSSFTPSFSIQGNQGDNWKKGTIIIGQQVSTYQIVFVAYRRTSYVSDIAIDDVKLYNCSERQAVETECDFEFPKLCGWSQDKTDDFDWVMATRRTPTASTGPDRDYTFEHGDYGHYMYAESSSPRTYGDVARFLSPIYDKTDEGLCFEFWYYLKGPTGPNLTGDLKVYILQEGGTLPDPTNSSFIPSFSIQGNQGDNWKKGNIVIGQQVSTYQIVFVAFRRTSYVSDIAIDDVKLYNCSEKQETTTLMTETEESTDTIELTTAGSTTAKNSRVNTSFNTLSAVIFPRPKPKSTTNSQTKTTSSVLLETSYPDVELDITTNIPTNRAIYTTKQVTRDMQNTKTASSDDQTTSLIISTKIDMATSDSKNSTSSGDDTARESTTHIFVNSSQMKTLFETDNSKNSTYIIKSKQFTKHIPINNGESFTSKPHPPIINSTNAPNASDDSFPNLILTKPKPPTSIPLKPLIIGMGIGVALGLLVVVIGIHLWMRKKRKKELQCADEIEMDGQFG